MADPRRSGGFTTTWSVAVVFETRTTLSQFTVTLAASAAAAGAAPRETKRIKTRMGCVNQGYLFISIAPLRFCLLAKSSRRSSRGMRKNVKNRDRFLYHDLQFHLSIMKACGNDVLKRMMSVVLETLFDHGAHVARNYGDLATILALHGNILGALRRRDPRAEDVAMK